MYPEAHLIYFSVAGAKAVYSVQNLSGEVTKVFDLPEDALKMAPYKFGNKFGLLVLSGQRGHRRHNKVGQIYRYLQHFTGDQRQ